MKRNNIRFDFKSLKFKLWMYFVCFAVLIIAVVWIAQVYMLNNSYETMKAKQVTTYAQMITSDYRAEGNISENFLRNAVEIAIENDMDIIVECAGSSTYYINQNGELSAFDSRFQQPGYTYVMERAEIRKYLETEGRFSGYSSRNLGRSNDYKILIYGTYLDKLTDGGIILYLFSPLYPVASTISILKMQLLLVTIIALVLALIMATYLARRVSKPLTSMRKSAVKLSNGEYGIDFPGGHYSEIIELGDTLTYTSHELAKSDQLHKDLIANVSHDLKTPLTMVKSYAEMIRDLSGDIPEKRNDHLQVIIEETDRLNLLVNDMFTLSKMQSGVTELDKTDFNLADAAREIFHLYDILVEQDGYNITSDFPETVMVYGDEAKLKQVFENLINNAVKYCGDDKYIHVTIRIDGPDAIFEVTDHGIGIPEDQLQNVWDRYYRVSSNYHRSSKGTGLGLSIVKEILLKHNAKFGVDSKEGEGSRFWFSINTVK